MEEVVEEKKVETPIVETPKKEKCPWLKKEALSMDAFVVAIAILVGAILVTLAVWLPQMDSKGSAVAQQDKNALAPAPEEAGQAAPQGPVTVSLDKDPVLGDAKKAKVAIIEFSDLECPFCKRFHKESYDALVKKYVDSGEAVLVARDFPLSFHDPKATEEAAVAECVRAEKGDAAYFAFTKDVYENTQTNGKGLPEGKMMELLKKAGVNTTKVLACSEADATKEEIAKDIADGTQAGITGTPSFVIGKLNEDGTVTGEVVVGALPLSGFETVVDKYLK